MSDENIRIRKANREAWEEVAPIHYRHNQAELIEEYKSPDYNVLDEIEVRLFNSLGIKGKDVAQVCCNNGRELLSVERLGAARCVGFDGALGFIEQARELAQAAKSDAEFVCTDIYEMPEEYFANFDVVTITIGVISWMPDVNQFFNILKKLLKPDGALFIYEQHPILDMIEPGEAGAPLTWEVSYFSKEPYVETGGLDYFGGEQYDAKPVTSFLYTMSEVIMAGINSGLALEHFEEFPHHISNTWWNVEAAGVGLPMCYTLVMRNA